MTYTAEKLIEKLREVEWAGTTYEVPVWLYEALLEHLQANGNEHVNNRLAEADQRTRESWAAAQMERESVEYWKAKHEKLALATRASGPRIVLTYGGLLMDDDSPLLRDKEWLEGAIGSCTEEDGTPLMRLAVHPTLTDQEAVDYVLHRADSTGA